MRHGDWCLPNDICSSIIQQIDRIFKDGMSLKELCMKLMEYFNLTARTACNYTNWLINTMPVYLPDRKIYTTPHAKFDINSSCIGLFTPYRH